MLYSELQCSEAIHKAVERMGFAEMTEIQEKTIPVMLAGRDVIAKAPTGTGKTCAFGIPVAEHIDPEKKYPQAVIIDVYKRQVQIGAAGVQAFQLAGHDVIAKAPTGTGKTCRCV